MSAAHETLRWEDARRFVEDLGELSGDKWLDAAARARRDERAWSLAHTAVCDLLKEPSVALDAWYLSDGIETAAWCRLRQLHRSPATRHAEDAARAAALAVLLRPRLNDRWFRVLHEPFATVLPQRPLRSCR